MSDFCPGPIQMPPDLSPPVAWPEERINSEHADPQHPKEGIKCCKGHDRRYRCISNGNSPQVDISPHCHQRKADAHKQLHCKENEHPHGVAVPFQRLIYPSPHNQGESMRQAAGGTWLPGQSFMHTWHRIPVLLGRIKKGVTHY